MSNRTRYGTTSTVELVRRLANDFEEHHEERRWLHEVADEIDLLRDKVKHWEDKETHEAMSCYVDNKELDRLRGIIRQMVWVKAVADGGDALLSNQGQGMDGYSELANYRAILSKLGLDT